VAYTILVLLLYFDTILKRKCHLQPPSAIQHFTTLQYVAFYGTKERRKPGIKAGCIRIPESIMVESSQEVCAHLYYSSSSNAFGLLSAYYVAAAAIGCTYVNSTTMGKQSIYIL
jgi:hypothetical protein